MQETFDFYTLIIIITFLFAVDSFGGGFIARSFITFWLIKKFSLSEATLSIIFIIAQVLNGLSLVIAPKIAKSIGVLNTMILSQMIANGIIIVAALSGLFSAMILTKVVNTNE